MTVESVCWALCCYKASVVYLHTMYYFSVLMFLLKQPSA